MRILDIMNVMLVGCIFYLVWCMYDFQANPAPHKVISYVIHDKKQVGEPIPYNPDSPSFTVKRGQDITINFNVVTARSGSVNIERIITDNNTENVGFSANRYFDAGTDATFPSYYKLPMILSIGCNHTLYSRNSYYLRGNVISFFKPIVAITPKVTFCVSE